MTESAIAALAPGVELSARGDCSGVSAAATNAHHIPATEGLNHPGSVTGSLVAMAELPIIPFTPGVDFSLRGKSQAMFTTRVDRNLIK